MDANKIAENIELTKNTKDMIKRIITIAFAILPTLGFAQNQQGYVKTKGRLANNGTLIKGTRLSGATVTVKGRNAVLSGSNGTFTLTLPGNNYYLQNVQKQGYVVTDPDILSRQYSYSKNPLVLVLETQEQQIDDRLEIQRKIRHNLERQLQQRQDEIDALRNENKITKQEYQERMQKLYDEQDKDKELINEMAERYSKIDYDQLDEFNTQISRFILNGELQKADSLLKTKGDINKRASDLRQLQEVNMKNEAELNLRKKKLEKNKELAMKELEDIGQDCFSKFEIFRMQHQNDSAAYYIDFRANLDTTNIEWLLDAGQFSKNYLAKYKKAEEYYKKAETILLDNTSDNNLYAIGVYIALSSLYHEIGQYQKSVDYSQKALSLINESTPDSQQLYAKIYSNLGCAYEYLDRWDEAQDFLNKSLQASIESFGKYHQETAICYSNLGIFYQKMEQDSLALSCFLSALEIGERDSIACYEDLDYFYNNLSVIYNRSKNYEAAELYSQKALNRRIKLYGENHPKLAVIYHNSGVRRMKQRKYEEALEYIKKATIIWENSLGEEHHLLDTYGTTGQIYELMGDIGQALVYYEKGAEVGIKYYGRDNSEAWALLPSICMTLEELIKTNPSDSIIARYQQLQSETAVIAIIPGGIDTPAAKLGMSGIYFILEYGKWNIEKTDSFFEEFMQLQGKPRNVVFMQNGKIETHHFEKSIGGNFMMRYVTPEEKTAIIETYKTFKKSN